MTNQPQLQLLPLAKLSLAPENARFGFIYDKDELKVLAGSIVAAGRLLEPLHVYPDGDGWRVWDGGRRLTALQGLAAIKAKGQGLPATLAAGVPCLVEENGERARLHSAATFVRQDMHPAEEFLAYKAIFDQGHTEAEVAALCAVPEPRVRQLLRLRSVAPEIIDAFKGGKLALDAVEAFSITEDHQRQLAVLKAAKKTLSAWDVRQALRKDSVSGGDWLARFVGVEAYKAAGGQFLVDLFGHREDEADWADGDIALKLGDQLIDARMEKLKAQGWGAVVMVQPGSWNWDKGFAQLSKEQQTDVHKARCTVFLRCLHGGKLGEEKWYARPSKGEATTAAGKAAQADPAAFGWGQTGHAELTMIAAAATRAALVRNPAAAYDAALSHLAWLAFRQHTGERHANELASLLDRSHVWGRPNVDVAGDHAVDAMHEAWDGRLPQDRVAFCDYVAGLDPEEKAALLAYSFAFQLEAYEPRTDQRKPGAWAHLGWMAQHAGLQIATEWTPDEAFLKRGTREALEDGLVACGEKAPATAKKGDLVKLLAKAAKAKGWVPKLLATLKGEPDEATVETLTPAQALILAEINHKFRADAHEYRLRPEGPVERVVLIQPLTAEETAILRPLIWGGFFSSGLLPGVGQFLKPHDKTAEGAKRLGKKATVGRPYRTRFLNSAETAEQAA